MLNIRLLGVVAVAAGALLVSDRSDAAEDIAARCAELEGVSLPPAAIGQLTTGATIVSATMTDSSDPNGEFCKIVGAIHPVDKNAPDINFELNVPRNWNGKALHLGGGGYDGTVVTGLAANFLGRDAVQPLKRGYATFGSDSGHKGPAADASFGTNDEALANFGGNQLKKTHDAAVQLLRRVAGAAPRRMYFEGNSQGGHEGFNVVQRWPRDYDGVVSIHPVYNITALQLDGVHVGQALYNVPGAWISPAKTKLIYDSVMKTCDSLDGAADGVIANVKGCRAAFKVDSLRCAGGKDSGDACLSDAQLGTVRTIGSRYEIGFALEDGVSSFAPWPLIEGGSSLQIFNFGAKPTASNPPVAPAFGPPTSAPPTGRVRLRDGRCDGAAHGAARPEGRHAEVRPEAARAAIEADIDDSRREQRGARAVPRPRRQTAAVAWHRRHGRSAAEHHRLLRAARRALRRRQAQGLRAFLRRAGLWPRRRPLPGELGLAHRARHLGRERPGARQSPHGRHGDGDCGPQPAALRVPGLAEVQGLRGRQRRGQPRLRGGMRREATPLRVSRI